MAMLTGGKQAAEINLTPMIDVLLVLLIIFMLIAPSSGLETEIPQPGAAAPRPQRDIEIWTQPNGIVRLDGQNFPVAELPEHLLHLLGADSPGTVFVHGEPGLDFGEIAAVVDEVKGAGLKQVALMTR